MTKPEAGSCCIVVSDLSEIHNFALRGSGVNKATSVPGTSTTTWTLKLRKGVYRRG